MSDLSNDQKKQVEQFIKSELLSELSTDQKDKVRDYIKKITAPLIFITAIVSGLFGYFWQDYMKSRAELRALTEYSKTFNSLVQKAAQMNAEANVVVDRIKEKEREAAKVFGILNDFKENSDGLAENEAFIDNVVERIKVLSWVDVTQSPKKFSTDCIYKIVHKSGSPSYPSYVNSDYLEYNEFDFRTEENGIFAFLIKTRVNADDKVNGKADFLGGYYQKNIASINGYRVPINMQHEEVDRQGNIFELCF